MSLPRFSRFVVILYVWLGVVLRLRILFGAAMPPAEPAGWLLVGAAEDLVVAILFAAITFLIFRRLPRAGGIVLSIALLLLTIAQYALSEAILFFGHPLRGDDFETDFHPLLFIGSATGSVLAGLLITIAIFVTATVIAWRRAHVVASAPQRRYLASAGAILLVIAPVAAWQEPAGTSANALVSIVSLLRQPRFYDAAPPNIPAPRLDLRSVRELAGNVDPGDFFDDAWPMARRPSPSTPRSISLPPGLKPNIVFITLEGLRAEEVGVCGNDPPGITPNLDRLAREGIRVDHAYSSGRFTPEGELAIWYGLPASPYELAMRSESRLKVTGVPEILRAAGWRSFLWIHDSDARLYLAGRFYRAHGVRVIDGRDFPTTDPSTSWGYSDRSLMRHAIDALDRLPQPFAAMVLTISNHHPFKLPPDARSRLDVAGALGATLGRQTGTMLQTEHYTDDAVGEFFATAARRPWFRNTIFVICADHGNVVAPAGGGPVTEHRFFELLHRIPLIFYSPLLPAGRVIPGPASQIDILPTLLGLLNISLPRATPGRDLFASARDPQRPVIAWASPPREITIATGRYVYHAFVPLHSNDLTKELLVDDTVDPAGYHNLAASERKTVQYCRRMATIFLDVYPWLLTHNRAGVPSLQ